MSLHRANSSDAKHRSRERVPNRELVPTVLQMQRSFHAVIARQAPVSWLFPSAVQIDQKFPRHCAVSKLSDGCQQSSPSLAQSYVLTGGGVALYEHAAGSAEPDVAQNYVAVGRHVLAVFCGYLSNLEDLLDRHGLHGLDGRRSGACGAEQGPLAAHVLHSLYQHYAPASLMVLLSELQGEFVFVIYDETRKRVFAARSPSFRYTLFQAVDRDGCLHLTNQALYSASCPPLKLEVPLQAWQGVPPGHCITGRNFDLQQYALTPGQLFQRHSLELLEESSPPQHAFHEAWPPPVTSQATAHGRTVARVPRRQGSDLDIDNERFVASMQDLPPRPSVRHYSGSSNQAGAIFP